jgi:hypothetical protein
MTRCFWGAKKGTYSKKCMVKISLLLTNEALCQEDVWRSGYIEPCILDLGLDRGEWSASRPGHFTPREMAPGTYWIGGWGLQNRYGRRGKEKIFPYCDSNSDPLAAQPVASRYTECTIPVPTYNKTLQN